MKYVLGVAGLIVLLVGIRAYRALGRITFTETKYSEPEPPYEYPAVVPTPDWP